MIAPGNNIYYASDEKRSSRADLEYAISLCDGNNIAVACDCGVGTEIAVLLKYGFKVHAFDPEKERILRCEERFRHYYNVFLYNESLYSFNFPAVSLIVADVSLFKCRANKFDQVWGKIYRSLNNGGIFSGCFLGVEDSMAQEEYSKDEFFSDALAFDERQVRDYFSNYDIKRFVEHKTSSVNGQGITYNQHIFSVVAQKFNA